MPRHETRAGDANNGEFAATAKAQFAITAIDALNTAITKINHTSPVFSYLWVDPRPRLSSAPLSVFPSRLRSVFLA